MTKNQLSDSMLCIIGQANFIRNCLENPEEIKYIHTYVNELILMVDNLRGEKLEERASSSNG